MQKRNDKKTNVTIQVHKTIVMFITESDKPPGRTGKFPMGSDLTFLSTLVLDQTMCCKWFSIKRGTQNKHKFKSKTRPY